MHRISGFVSSLAIVSALSVGVAYATPINVLWYSYATLNSEYRSFYSSFAKTVANYPESSGLSWNLTFFAPGSAQPVFSHYNVLVIESGEAFRTGPMGGPLAIPDYSGILNDKSAIQAARGGRTLISGADADFHGIRGDSGTCPTVHCGSYDGARGYVINSVNWAASGRGLGIVSFVDGEFPGSFWWNDPRSFLQHELSGHVRDFGTSHENSAVINLAESAYPLNHGLSSTGLSNWFNAFHAGFTGIIPGYTATVDSGDGRGALSLATSAFVFVPTAAPTAAGAVDAPGTLLLVASGLGLALGSRRYRKREALATPFHSLNNGIVGLRSADPTCSTSRRMREQSV